MPLQAGYDKYAIWSPAGAPAGAHLNITGHSWEPAIKALNVTHSGTGGIAAKLAGVLDGKGRIDAFYDTSVTHLAAGIVPGTRGILSLWLGGLTPFQIPGMIVSVPYESKVDDTVKYSFNVEMDWNAITANAGYVLPT